MDNHINARVKRAVDTKTGQMVAIKVISKPGPYDLSSGKKFNRLQAEVSGSTKYRAFFFVVVSD